MKQKTIMKITLSKQNLSGSLLAAGTLALAGLILLFVVLPAKAQDPAAPAKPKPFTTAEEAAEALIAAAEKFDQDAFKEILGPDSYAITQSGEPARDRQIAKEFATLARQKMKLSVDPVTKRRAFIEIGEDNWAFPVPIVKQGAKWSFDTKVGRQEIIYRRIGKNELDAIEVARGYVEAQHEYALTKHDGAIVNQYAQRIISTPGKQDGLAWQNPDGTWGGTVGERAARALEQSYTGTPAPFHGYFFKVLKGQGPAAPLGEMDFVVKGAMIGGFALIAYPSIYRVTGVKTFMVSHDGVVYEKDLGSDTLKLAQGIERFNPDRTWTPVPEEEDEVPSNVGVSLY